MLLYLLGQKKAAIADGTVITELGTGAAINYMSASKAVGNRTIGIGNGKVLRFTASGYAVETAIASGVVSMSLDGNYTGQTYYDSYVTVLKSAKYVGTATWQQITENFPKGSISVNWYDANTKLYAHSDEVPYLMINGVRTNLGSVILGNPYARFNTAFDTILLVGHYNAAKVFQKNGGVWDNGVTLTGTKNLTASGGGDMSADGNIIVHALTNGGVGVFKRNASKTYDLIQTIAAATAAGISADGSVIAVTASAAKARIYKLNGSGTYDLAKTSSQTNLTATYPTISVEPMGQYVTMATDAGLTVLHV